MKGTINCDEDIRWKIMKEGMKSTFVMTPKKQITKNVHVYAKIEEQIIKIQFGLCKDLGTWKALFCN